MHQRLATTICFLVLTQLVGSSAAGETFEQKPLVEFPFEEGAGNKLFVLVGVNKDARAWWFVIDTGAPTTHLDYRCAQALGLKLQNERLINVGAGSGQKIRAATTDDVSFHVQDQEYRRASVDILDLQHVAEIMGRPVDGLLGNDFIQRYAFEIDYQGGTIRLYDTDAFEPAEGGHAIPVDLSSNRPEVRAIVSNDGKTLDCDHLIVDTGANYSLYLSRHIVDEHELLSGRPDIVSGVVSRGAGGDTKGAIVRLDYIQLDAMRVSEPIAILSQDTSGFFAYKRHNGIVGGELLRRSKVTFDYARKRMILEPYEDSAPIAYDKSGLLIRALSPDFNVFEVVSVLERTPAAAAGVVVGDRILQINGQLAESMTLVAITRVLRQVDGTPIRLKLQRGKKSVSVALILKDYAA